MKDIGTAFHRLGARRNTSANGAAAVPAVCATRSRSGRAAFGPREILETAAGTGVVTRCAAAALPDAEIVATDLNQPMLDVAATARSIGQCAFRQADALDLPFDDAKLRPRRLPVRRHVLSGQGEGQCRSAARASRRRHYLFAIWDRIERNSLTASSTRAVEAIPDNSAAVHETRGRSAMTSREWIERDLTPRGFGDVRSRRSRSSRRPSATMPPTGFAMARRWASKSPTACPGSLERVFKAVEQAFRRFEGSRRTDAPMPAHIVTATSLHKPLRSPRQRRIEGSRRLRSAEYGGAHRHRDSGNQNPGRLGKMIFCRFMDFRPLAARSPAGGRRVRPSSSSPFWA